MVSYARQVHRASRGSASAIRAINNKTFRAAAVKAITKRYEKRTHVPAIRRGSRAAQHIVLRTIVGRQTVRGIKSDNSRRSKTIVPWSQYKRMSKTAMRRADVEGMDTPGGSCTSKMASFEARGRKHGNPRLMY